MPDKLNPSDTEQFNKLIQFRHSRIILGNTSFYSIIMKDDHWRLTVADLAKRIRIFRDFAIKSCLAVDSKKTQSWLGCNDDITDHPAITEGHASAGLVT